MYVGFKPSSLITVCVEGKGGWFGGWRCNHFALLSLLSSFWVKEGNKSIQVFRRKNNDNINKLRKPTRITYEQNLLIIVEGI